MLAVIAAVASLAGVTGASATTEATPSSLSGSIRFLTSSTQQAGWTIMINNFNRVYPNVKVDVQYLAGGSAVQIQTLATQLQAGAGPDVFQNYPGTGGAQPSMGQNKDAGYLLDLSAQPWAKKTPKIIKSVSDIGGKTYGLDTGVGFQAMIYNSDKFRELGLTIPTTFAQLETLCRTIRQKSSSTIPIAFAGGNAAFNGYAAGQFAVSNVYASNPYWNTQRKNGQKTFAGTPGWRAALQSFIDLKNANCFSPSVVSDGAAQVIGQLATGQAVMSMNLTGQYGSISAAASNTKFAVFAIPGASKATTRLFAYPAAALSVNSASKNKEAAVAFINFIARPKQTDVLNKAGGYGQMAPYNFGKGVWPETMKPLLPLLEKTVVAPFFNWPTLSTYNVMASGVQGLLTGQKSVDQVLADMDYTWGK